MKTRVRDVVAAAGIDWVGVVDGGTGSVDLSAFFDRDHVPVARDSGTDAIATDRLLALGAGPQTKLQGSLDTAVDALARVGVGGHAILLLGWPAAELSGSPVAGRLAASGFEPVHAAATPYPEMPIALLVVRRSEAPARVQPTDDDAEPERDEPGALAFQQTLAVAAADWLADEVAIMRARLTSRGDSDDPVVQVAELARERAALAATLSKVEADLKAERDKVRQMEASTSMRVGKALVRAAKNPRAAARLPRQAVRMWRMRGGRAGLAEARKKSSDDALAATASAEAARLVAWRGASLEPRTQISVLGVLRPQSESSLLRHSFVVAAMPDDVLPLFERADPDLVLIETAVSAAPSPWAYLGNPVATERERRLIGLVDAAQGLGRPVVLWRNTPVHETAALDDFAKRCDLVVDSAPARSGGTPWSIGLSLSDAVDLGSDRSARTSVLYAGGFDPRDSLRRKAMLVEALEAAGPRLTIRPRRGGPSAVGFPAPVQGAVGREVTWEGYVAACRAAAVVVASPFVVPDSMLGLRDDDLVALASGARLVSGPNRDLAALPGLGSAVRIAQEHDIADVVRAAVADGPLTDSEHLAVLRTLALSHTVAPRLRSLVDRLALDVEVGHERGTAVVVPPGTSIDTHLLVESVLRQSLRPTELAVSRHDVESLGALHELAALGVAVRTVAGAHVGFADLARAVDAPWLATWSPALSHGSWKDSHVLDLVIGAEAGDADAVTLATAGGVSAVPTLGSGDTAVLLRRSLVVADDPDVLDLSQWSRRGRTLVAVGSGDLS